jgi:hypothetical protein
MKNKFKPGQTVKYRSQVAGGIHLAGVVGTKVIGFNDMHENLWKRQYCKLSCDFRPKKVKPGEGAIEKRYIIEHAFGWYPSVQGDNVKIPLEHNHRYFFAYESELRHFERKENPNKRMRNVHRSRD